VGVVALMVQAPCGGSWWLGDRDTFQATTAPTACIDSFGRGNEDEYWEVR
jgi:hypothetical protein